MLHYDKFSTTKSKGFILILTLFFLIVFSLTTIAELTFIRLNLKTARHRWERNRHLLSSYTMLRTIENQFLLQPYHCIISAIPTHVLIKRHLSWWKENACFGTTSSISYFFILEKLERNPCGIIEKIDENHFIIADYYRITLLSMISSIDKIFLQSTVVASHLTTQRCTETPYQAKIGRQNWREW